jgi:hypothetical protein
MPEAANRLRVQEGPQSGPPPPLRGMAHLVAGIASRPARNRPNEHSMRDSEEELAARVARECAEQGISVAIDDPVTIAKIMTLMRDGRASTSATKAARLARRGRPSSSAKGR